MRIYDSVNYVKFACREFKNIQLLKNIYNTLIKFILNYGSVIWNIEKKLEIEKLEKVKHIFLRFLSYKTSMPMSFIDHKYDPIMNLISITSLQNSRAINDFKFLFKLSNNEIRYPEFRINKQVSNL